MKINLELVEPCFLDPTESLNALMSGAVPGEVISGHVSLNLKICNSEQTGYFVYSIKTNEIVWSENSIGYVENVFNGLTASSKLISSKSMMIGDLEKLRNVSKGVNLMGIAINNLNTFKELALKEVLIFSKNTYEDGRGKPMSVNDQIDMLVEHFNFVKENYNGYLKSIE
jgi:hypothetical protein